MIVLTAPLQIFKSLHNFIKSLLPNLLNKVTNKLFSAVFIFVGKLTLFEIHIEQWKRSLPVFLKEVSLDRSSSCSTRRIFHWSPRRLDSEFTATRMMVSFICPGVQSPRERRYRWSLTVSPRWIAGWRRIVWNSTRTRPNSFGWVVANNFSRSKSIPSNLALVRFLSSRLLTTLE